MIKENYKIDNSFAKYNKVADRIEKVTGVNIFDKKRTLEIVDARATACYIYRKYYNGTLHSIADYFKKNGKNFDHSTVHYNVRLFDQEVRNRRRDISDRMNFLIGSIDGNTQLNIVIDTILSDEDKNRIIAIVNRLVNKYKKDSVI